MNRAGASVFVGTVALVCATAFVPASADGAFDLIASFGGSGEGMFASQVTGLAVDAHGDVYVVDGENASRVEEFSAGGTFMAEWGSKGEGAGQMSFPVGIAIAAGGVDAGDIYVADAGNRRVDEFRPEGAFIRAWGWGVINGKLEAQVCTTSCVQGQPHGEDGGGFEGPVGVAVDPSSGDVYASDPMTNDFALPLQKFTAEGAFIKTVGLAASLHEAGAPDTFVEPVALATDAAGDLYVVDGGNERVQELGAKEEFLRVWGRGVHKGESGPSEHFGVCTSGEECQLGGQGEEAGAFEFIEGSPEAIAIDPSGNVWVPDPGNERVQEFTSAGSFKMAFGWGVLDAAEKFETCTSVCKAGYKGIQSPAFEDPLGAASALSGCPIYVTDAGANELVDEFGTCGTEEKKEEHKEEKEEGSNGKSSGTGNSQQTPSTTGTAANAGLVPPGIATAPRAVEELILGCTKRPLVLNDVLIHGSLVELTGSAARSLDGKKVKVIFDGAKQVATATVGTNGQFTTTAALPPPSLRDSNNARYQAVSASERSLNLKLARRLSLEPPRVSGHTVTLVGQIVPPLTKPVAQITVQQELECGKTTVVEHATPSANGHFRITVTVPAAAKAGVYRLTSSVRENTHSTRGFATYSLPLPAAFG